MIGVHTSGLLFQRSAMAAEPTAARTLEATEFLEKCTTGPLLVLH